MIDSAPSMSPPGFEPSRSSRGSSSAAAPSGNGSVGLYGFAMLGVVMLVYLLVVPSLTAFEAPFHLPWWAFAIAFGLSELWAEHLYAQRASHPFSTGELALVLGLLLAEPGELMLAQVVGSAAVLAWRHPAARLPFMLGQTAMSGGVALLTFHALLETNDSTDASTWIATLGATMAGGSTSLAIHALGIKVAGASPDWRAIARTLRVDVVITAATTSIGLSLTILLILEAQTAWLLVAPGIVAMVAYRTYLKERQQRQRLDFLHETTDTLSTSPDFEQALLDLLDRSRTAFRAEFAETILLPSDGTAPRRTRVSPVERLAVREVPTHQDAILRELAYHEDPVRRIARPASDPELEAYLVDAGVRGPAMLAVIAGEHGPLGLLLIADRPDVDRAFRRHDAELLEQLASRVAGALEHDTLEQDFGRLAQLQGQLEHMAFHDSLTGLANRSRFIDQTRHSLARRGARVAALFIDLDDFKTVNDSLGHKAGDELLISVAERLRSCLRAHDTPARLGGDEFAVLVEDADMEVVLEIAERILAALSEPFALGEAEVAVLGSIGVATSGDGVRRAEDLVRNADLAMYRAKSEGKGCIELFEPQMHAKAVQRHEIKTELSRAVEDDQLVVHFQPVVDLASGVIVGVEALVRWQHPRLGLLGPGAFIPIAEESGLIDEIGSIVMRKACERLAAWRRVGIADDDFRLSLNLSAREFGRPDLVRSLVDAVAEAGIPTSAVTLEITESAIMHDIDAAIRRMELIKAAGFRLGLDDFGTGYSSLSHLRKFPIDVLKVAKPFVDHIAERQQDADFLRSVLALAKTLSLDVIVEGVETAEQAHVLLGLGDCKVQGFVFSKAVEDRALSLLLTLTPLRGFAEASAITAPTAELPGAPAAAPARA